MVKVLRLKFKVEPKGYYEFDIDQPKANITEAEVKELMNKMITEKIVKPKNGEISSIESAVIIEETTVSII